MWKLSELAPPESPDDHDRAAGAAREDRVTRRLRKKTLRNAPLAEKGAKVPIIE
jgi:hypothetical protein